MLGVAVGDSEDEAFWSAFLRDLRARGLSGVQLVISDQHSGLVAAIRKVLQGAAHQRCRVHFARNLLASVPKGHQEMVAAAFRTIFAYATKEEIEQQWDHVEATLEERFPKAVAMASRLALACDRDELLLPVEAHAHDDEANALAATLEREHERPIGSLFLSWHYA